MGAGKGGQPEANDKKKEQADGKKEKKEKTDGADDGHEAHAEKNSLEMNVVDEGMHDALVSIQFAAQPWFNR
eukprot:1136503-Rhodomonas_salina.1